MTSNGLFLFFIVFVVASAGYSQQSTDMFYVCKRDRMVRWLKAYKLENGKCQTLYSKEGFIQVVSSATYFSSCESVLHSVQKNLEDGGFNCAAIEKHAYLEID